jgi:hypothetical protein
MRPAARPTLAILLTLCLGLAGCATHVDAGFDQVGPGYSTWGGNWNTGGGISAVVRVFERNGGTVVCGAWATDPQSVLSTTLNEDVMEAASAFMGRARLVQGLGFMQRVPYADDITGAQARCVLSKVPWQAEFANVVPILRFPRYAILEDVGEFGFPRYVIFRQTDRVPIVPQ